MKTAREILQNLVDYGNLSQSQEDINCLINKALKELRELVPRKKTWLQSLNTISYKEGWNDCREEMLKRLGVNNE